MSNKNQGIQMNGGTINAEQLAVGDKAQATKTTYTVAEGHQSDKQNDLANAIAELLQSLESHRTEITNFAEVSQAVNAVAEEVQKETPNKITLKGLLVGVKESVGSLAEIVQKIGVLQKAITTVTGIIW
ncbi:DUF5955 family protein [Roseofilum casamattae]|uniref:DUF5955 family protein n=1 Tax=Roseofilum casamattae BLCC-M143 TaxID=3022442 RepID=A0ABT7C387_9CYAN|nr:DUF5955 family protein [Roseofilum casamattae]MDJ1185927.1 DUF5955 family protein [Roseofilum casamattae BLCC-M143]